MITFCGFGGLINCPLLGVVYKMVVFMMRIVVKSERKSNFVPNPNLRKPMIYIESKRKSLEALQLKYPGAMIIDVTSKAEDEFVKFSPFYPNGGIPVPFTEDYIAASVEGIWQGLKVFENDGIDTQMFAKKDMKNMKRTTRKFGRMLGHRKGVHGDELLGYLEARKQIYLPCYKWVLENRLQTLVTAVRVIAKNKPVVLLDYNTNGDVNDLRRPLSHATLIKAYIEGCYPE